MDILRIAFENNPKAASKIFLKIYREDKQISNLAKNLPNKNMINIDGRALNDSSPPLLIAEISANHKKSLSRALKLVKMAAKAGFDAIKLQTYEADKITLKSKKKDFQIRDKKSIWYKRNLYDLYKKGQTLKFGTKKFSMKQKNLA